MCSNINDYACVMPISKTEFIFKNTHDQSLGI